MENAPSTNCTLSIVIPCYNEEATLRDCVQTVIQTFDSEPDIQLELIIVDDCSTDRSREIARELANEHELIKLCNHEQNAGKGAALRTGFQHATGDFVAIQDADLEYDPRDLVRLIEPLRQRIADAVYGSRFLSPGIHRVLYFWHSMGNRFLTLLSNMFTDLNLTDMETCYKVFRRDVIQDIDIKENRFGFEPEVTAKLAGKRLRIFEIGISYFGRTYEEGKKIGARDGLRALYCIIKYNAHHAPVGLQLAIYTLIGGTSAAFNLLVFAACMALSMSLELSAAVAFVLAAALNYLLCIWVLFRHRSRWNTLSEVAFYGLLVTVLGIADVVMTRAFVTTGLVPIVAKGIASIIGLVLNFAGRRALIFPEPGRGPWKPGRSRNA